jgi:hypothetical protein
MAACTRLRSSGLPANATSISGGWATDTMGTEEAVCGGGGGCCCARGCAFSAVKAMSCCRVWCLVPCWWLVLMFVMALDNSNAPRDNIH